MTRLRLLALAASVLTGLQTVGAAAKEVWLTMDYVQSYEIERPAGQVVVGNSGIADVTVQDSTRLLLFGKGPGTTNLFIHDSEGELIESVTIRVRALNDRMVTLQRGTARTTYNCLPTCDPTIVIGDDVESFALAAQQAQQKFLSATGAGGQ